MNEREAALDHERKLIADASSGRDNPFHRVGSRSDSYDDNGEPLCSEPEVDVIGKMPMPQSWADSFAKLSPIGQGARPYNEGLRSSILGIVRSQHHLNTEGV